MVSPALTGTAVLWIWLPFRQQFQLYIAHPAGAYRPFQARTGCRIVSPVVAGSSPGNRYTVCPVLLDGLDGTAHVADSHSIAVMTSSARAAQPFTVGATMSEKIGFPLR